MAGDSEKPTLSEATNEQVAPEPVGRWCLVANVVETREHGELHELRSGTRHFAPGAKVYCDKALWGDGWWDIRVLGRHRGSPKFVRLIMPRRFLHNFRAKLEYSPQVRRLLDGENSPAAYAKW